MSRAPEGHDKYADHAYDDCPSCGNRPSERAALRADCDALRAENEALRAQLDNTAGVLRSIWTRHGTFAAHREALAIEGLLSRHRGES